MTVLFTDIVGFTGLSERLGDAIVPVLSDYLEIASAAISSRNGTIDKFIGDAVMAFWGAPTPNDRHAVDACAAALEFRRRLGRRCAEPGRDGGVPLRMRVGINTGRMLVGNIGSNERLSYTVIGDAVNVASRLEAVNKRYGTEILIGEDTRAAAGDAILVRRLDWVAVYGRTQGLAVYELLGMADHGALQNAGMGHSIRSRPRRLRATRLGGRGRAVRERDRQSRQRPPFADIRRTLSKLSCVSAPGGLDCGLDPRRKVICRPR